jgi:hypothetical protein
VVTRSQEKRPPARCRRIPPPQRWALPSIKSQCLLHFQRDLRLSGLLIEVEGQGIEEVFDANLSPGETRTMQLYFAPGTYEVYCPVGNHRDQGMEIQLTVT